MYIPSHLYYLWLPLLRVCLAESYFITHYLITLFFFFLNLKILNINLTFVWLVNPLVFFQEKTQIFSLYRTHRQIVFRKARTGTCVYPLSLSLSLSPLKSLFLLYFSLIQGPKNPNSNFLPGETRVSLWSLIHSPYLKETLSAQ